MGEVVAQDIFLNWSLSQIASEFGIARETVTRRLKESGVESSGLRRGHPVYRVQQAAVAILVPKVSAAGGINDPDMMAPKERADWFKSENDRLKFEKESGLSIDTNESLMQMGEIAKRGLHVLETLPDILERDFNFPPDVIENVEERIDVLRNEWADAVESA